MMRQQTEEAISVAPSRGFSGFNSVGGYSNGSYGGAVGVASVGYGVGHGLRVEAEASYRYNDQNFHGNTLNGAPNREQKLGGMANLFYDFDVGLPLLYPYIGAGVGFMHVDRAFNQASNGVFAYQAIVGAATPLPFAPGLSLTLEYRFLGLDNSTRSTFFPGSAAFGSATSTRKFSNDYNHAVIIGLRYAFNTAPPTLPPGPPPVPAKVVVDRTYLVFFDWDRAELTDRARQIIGEAASGSRQVGHTRVEVQGNADRSGTPAYNQALSLRRAKVVAAELVRDGVSQSAIDIQAFGATRPLVPTAEGVREPQNRRVSIVFR